MGKLLAGAAKVRISPPQQWLDEMTELGSYTSFKGIYKDVYVRCIALSDGEKQFLIYSIEMGSFPGQRIFRQRLEQELGIDPNAVMLGNTHNHQMVGASDPAEQPPGMDRKGPRTKLDDINDRLMDFFHDRAMEAAREAISKQVPAKMGYASGESYINASRDWDTPLGGLQNSDYSGYSDRELVVMKVDTVGGEPIAMLVNFGVHSNMLYVYRFNDEFPYICGDLGGEIMEYVENATAGSYICGWVEAAAGDQNPLFMGALFEAKPDKDGKFHSKVNQLEAKSTIMIMEHLAAVQGLEILKTAEKIGAMSQDFDLKYGRSTVTIPGVVNARTRYHLAFKGGDDVNSRMTVLPEELRKDTPESSDPLTFQFHLAVLNGLAFCGINTEPYSYLGKIIKDVLPYPKAMVFAIDGGHLGYLPDVRKAEYAGFGTLDSHAKTPWDVEKAIYEGFRDLAWDLDHQ